MQINTKVQCNIFFSKIFSSSYSGGGGGGGGGRGTKDFGGVKNGKILYLKKYKRYK